MQNAAIEIFYLFFQGILSFQVIVFSVLFFVTRRRDLIYYSLFLFFAATYFFLNAPYTFFGIPEERVWNSVLYDYANTPLIIIENLFYLLFLKSFFADITEDKLVNRIFRFTLLLIPVLIGLFIFLTVLRLDKQFIFYTVKLITVLPAIIIAYIVLKRKLPFSSLVANGLLCTIIGTLLTFCMIVLRNYNVHHLFTDGYPLFFIRLGLLGDMIFYLAAILKKWHFQEKQLALEKLKSELAVEQIRNKISRELHDDIGSTLSGISMYSHIARNPAEKKDEEMIDKYLKTIQHSADEMVGKLSDIVWSVNPKEDSFARLIDRLIEYGNGMADTGKLKFVTAISGNIESCNLQMEVRRNLYMILKEALNNSLKYSEGNLLELIIKKTEGNLEFSVKDNGKGFDTVTIRRGNGLENMQKRSDEIGAKLILQSKENEGTSVSLQYKIT